MKILKITSISIVSLIMLLLILLLSLIRPDIPVEKLMDDYTDENSLFLTIDGMQVHVKDEGDGPTLLFLHGMFASLHTWDPWAEALEDQYRVVRVDLPGFGITGPHPQGDYSLRASMYLLESIREKLGIEQWSVIGNSMGGGLALSYAQLYPEHTENVVLFNGGRLLQAASETEPVPKPALDTEHEQDPTSKPALDTEHEQDPTSKPAPDTEPEQDPAPKPALGTEPDSNSSTATATETSNQPDNVSGERQSLILRALASPSLRKALSVLTPKFIIERALKEVYGNPDRLQPGTVTRYYELLRREGNRQAYLSRREMRPRRSGNLPDLPELTNPSVLPELPILPEPTSLNDSKVPVLILWGRLDSWIPVRVGYRLHEAIDHSRLIIYEDLGHVPMEEDPERTITDVKEFLMRVDSVPTNSSR
ncbi:MAG: alpha/beta fold hydrolase [Bacteroidetes bacterium]|nr:alpha/beta fold hydrolase [Bacteroidota bacterium]